MGIEIVGRKCGMTRIFTEEGASVPVTVIEVEPNRITQIKTKDNDGYSAIQVTTGTRKAKRVNKAQAGHFAKANTEAGRGLWEFRMGLEELHALVTNRAAEGEEGSGEQGAGELGLGSEITVSVFKEGQYVDVAGTSKGKGFAGVVKRYNFAMQDATHGNSLSHRAPGSIGQNQTPGRVFKGKKMAGQMGNVRCSVQSQQIVRIDNERNLLLVKGGVPGAPGGSVIIKPAVKKAS